MSRSACMSHLLLSGRRCYVVLGVIVAALSPPAASQNPVKINTHAKSTRKTEAALHECIARVLHKIFRPKFLNFKLHIKCPSI